MECMMNSEDTLTSRLKNLMSTITLVMKIESTLYWDFKTSSQIYDEDVKFIFKTLAK